jgi:hypothetical protein
MAELITAKGRKTIKKIAEISQVARALKLMPTGEEFALRLIGDMVIIAKKVNSISARLNDILDRYSSIPSDFLLEGFDVILDKLNDINDYARFALTEVTDLMSSTVSSVKDLTDAVGSATSAMTSAVIQVGGGLTYAAAAMGANIKMAMGSGQRSIEEIREEVMKDVLDGKIPVAEMEAEVERRVNEWSGYDNANNILDKTENMAKNSTEKIDGFFDNVGGGLDSALNWIDEKKASIDEKIDNNAVSKLIEKVESAKQKVEDAIERVKKTFEKLTKDFDDAFGSISGVDVTKNALNKVSDTAKEMDTPVFDALGELSDEVIKFIDNFSIGKVVTAIGGLVVGAGAATLAMDLLPRINVERMLKDIIGGVETKRVDKVTELYNNKYYGNEPDLLEVPDVPWRLSKDDLEKYNADGYNQYLADFDEENEKHRNDICERLRKVTTNEEKKAIYRENREYFEENKSAIKALRKVRRDAIKAKQIEKYKGFLKIELDYVKKECSNLKKEIKNDWDSMMKQYKDAVAEIKKFFSEEGCGGSESVDKCCDRINDDATQIVELCSSISTEITNTVAMLPTPYALGACFDMPVHKVLNFFKDLKIIVTFLKNLIRLGIDIISQLTVLAKIIANGMQSLAEIMILLKDLLGIDKLLNMIEFLIKLFKPKMADAKILLENSISPVYYNETEEYENRVNELEALLDGRGEDDTSIMTVSVFRYTDDKCAKNKKYETEYGGSTTDIAVVEEWLEELEEKGDREIVAYRSPILNAEGDDFAGWIFYHPFAYDYMNGSWSNSMKRRLNKVIKKASKKNKMKGKKLYGGVASLKKAKYFGYTDAKTGKYKAFTKTGYDAYYWYTKWTNDPTDCEVDQSNTGNDVVSPVQTTANGSLVELSDGRRVFVEGKVVKSGDFVNVDGIKYRVK